MTICREQFVGYEFEEPVGWLEASVAQIQAEILGIDRIGRTDSFHDFGGASLQAIRMCVRIQQQVGCKALSGMAIRG